MTTPTDARRKISQHILTFALVAALCGPAAMLQAADPAEFEIHNYDYRNDGVLTDGIDVLGRLFVPQQALDNPTLDYPLVVFFHGDGQRGFNNTSQVSVNIDDLLANAKTEGFFIYAPQLTSAVTYWTAGNMDKVVRKLAATSRAYNVDVSRIYVTGLSQGGSGAWDLTNRYGGGTAATVSICGTNPNGGLNFTGLVNRPIWSFHAANDGEVVVKRSRDRVNGIRNADGIPGLPALTWPPAYTDGVYFYDFHQQRYTEFQTGGHGIWNSVYADANLYTWMLGQSRPVATASLLAGETMYFDLGGTKTVTDGSGNTWNSTSATQYDTLEAMLPYCRTAIGRATPVSLSTLQKFGSQGGGVANATYGTGIGTDGWQTVASGTGTLVLQGLVPDASYNLKIFGSSSVSNRMTTYEVGDAFGTQTQDLNATGNVSTKAVFATVVADASGMIDISVRAKTGSGSTIGIINAIELSR